MEFYKDKDGIEMYRMPVAIHKGTPEERTAFQSGRVDADIIKHYEGLYKKFKAGPVKEKAKSKTKKPKKGKK